MRTGRMSGLCLSFLTVLLPCVFIINCAMTPEDYIRHYEKSRSKYAGTVKRNGVIARVVYVPCEYYAARDMMADKQLTLKDALKRYDTSLYFVLLLNAEKGSRESILLQRGGMENYKNNVLKNTFERDRDIFLLKDTDTVKVEQYHFDRSWGIGNGDSFTMVFSRKQARNPLKKYHLILRNFVPELGTIDIPLASLIKNKNRLKD